MTKQLTETEAEQQYRAFETARQIYRLICDQLKSDFYSQVERLRDNMAGVSEIFQLENWLNQNHWNFFRDPSLIINFLKADELATWNCTQDCSNLENSTRVYLALEPIWIADTFESLGLKVPFDGCTHFYHDGQYVFRGNLFSKTMFALILTQEGANVRSTIGNPLSYSFYEQNSNMIITNQYDPECSYSAIPKDELTALLAS